MHARGMSGRYSFLLYLWKTICAIFTCMKNVWKESMFYTGSLILVSVFVFVFFYYYHLFHFISICNYLASEWCHTIVRMTMMTMTIIMTAMLGRISSLLNKIKKSRDDLGMRFELEKCTKATFRKGWHVKTSNIYAWYPAIKKLDQDEA